MEGRARRAGATVAVAAAVVVVAGLSYLRPWQAPERRPAAAPSPVVIHYRVWRMQFVSADTGWAVAGDNGMLFHTADGGRHWQRQLGDQLGVEPTFFDTRNGVAVVHSALSTLWRTTDGGSHWSPVANPCQQVQMLVYFLNARDGWCVAFTTPFAAANVGPSSIDLALYRTGDGGATWSRIVETGPANPVSNGIRDDDLKTWIWFRDRDVGWMGGQAVDGTGLALYGTMDGGDHWASQELAQPSGGWGPAPGPFVPTPPSRGLGPQPTLEVYQDGSAPALASPYVYLNQGPSWTGPMRLPAGAVSAVSTDGSARWLAATSGSVAATDDGGDHWRSIGSAPAGWLFTQLEAVDARHIWALMQTPAAEEGRLARSSDGGRHWALVGQPSLSFR